MKSNNLREEGPSVVSARTAIEKMHQPLYNNSYFQDDDIPVVEVEDVDEGIGKEAVNNFSNKQMMSSVRDHETRTSAQAKDRNFQGNVMQELNVRVSMVNNKQHMKASSLTGGPLAKLSSPTKMIVDMRPNKINSISGAH